jgi:hypothetical protein
MVSGPPTGDGRSIGAEANCAAEAFFGFRPRFFFSAGPAAAVAEEVDGRAGADEAGGSGTGAGKQTIFNVVKMAGAKQVVNKAGKPAVKMAGAKQAA